MKRKFLSICCSTTLILTTSLATSNVSFAETILTPQEAFSTLSEHEKTVFNELAEQLGYSSAVSFIEAAMSMDRTNPTIYDLYGNDGHASIDDALFLSQFLLGQYQYAYDYVEMDANNDNKVDSLDVNTYLVYYSGYLTHQNDGSAITTHITSSYTPEAIQYYKYSASTGAYLGNYSLAVAPTCSVTPSDSGESTESNQLNLQDSEFESVPIAHTGDNPLMPRMVNENIIDNYYPSGGAVKIITQFGTDFENEAFGSGMIIDAHTIATVAHAVYNESSAIPTSNCKVKIQSIKLFSNTGSVINTTITPVQMHVPYKYITGYYNNNNNLTTDGYDYALITVQQDLSNYVSMELGLALDAFMPSLVNGTAVGPCVYNSGTPGTIGGTTVNNTTNLHQLVTTGGNTFNFTNAPNYIIGFAAPPTASGAALYHPSSQSIIGLVNAASGSYGQLGTATRIRSEMLRFFLYNSNATY